MGLIHLGCPSCGGTLSLAEGQRVVRCQYCGGESLALVPGTVPRHVVAMGISREGALAAGQKFLDRPGLARALRESGRVQEVSLCYIPFYEFTGTRLGTFLLRDGGEIAPVPMEEGGQDEVFQGVLHAPRAEKEDTRVIQREFVRVGPACDAAEFGIDAIRLENLRRGPTPVALEPYDAVTLQSRATVLAPTKPPARFVGDSQMRIKVRGDRTGVVEQRLKLLYYPVWQIGYRHAGRLYEVAVDGVTGKVLRARVPLEIREAAGIAAGALALAAFCFGRPARQLIRAGLPVGNIPAWLIGALASLPVLALGGAMALVLAWVGWHAFRQGGEALLDEEAGRPLMEGDWGPGPLGQMSAKLAEWLLGLKMGSGGRG